MKEWIMNHPHEAVTLLFAIHVLGFIYVCKLLVKMP